MVSLRQNSREFWLINEEAIRSGADRWCAEGGRTGVPVVELIRKIEISEQTFYRWKAKYVGLEVDRVCRMKQFQEENLRLRQLVAELTPYRAMLRAECLDAHWFADLNEAKRLIEASGSGLNSK
jgi:putative transposase